jgi:hypothetical protein
VSDLKASDTVWSRSSPRPEPSSTSKARTNVANQLAQSGHASIESTRIYLHLADDWLASQYRKAAEVLDAQLYVGQPKTAGGSVR